MNSYVGVAVICRTERRESRRREEKRREEKRREAAHLNRNADVGIVAHIPVALARAWASWACHRRQHKTRQLIWVRVPQRSEPCRNKRHSLSQLFVCLSGACLGKYSVFSLKWCTEDVPAPHGMTIVRMASVTSAGSCSGAGRDALACSTRCIDQSVLCVSNAAE